MSKRVLGLAAVMFLALPLGCATEKSALKKLYDGGLAPLTPMGLEQAGLVQVWEKNLREGLKNWEHKPEITAVWPYDETVLVATKDNMIYCFDRKSGAFKWLTVLGSQILQRPTFFDGSYYAASTTRLVTIDDRGYETVGKQFRFGVSKPLYVTDDYLFAVGSDGALHKIDRTELTEVWPAPARTSSVILGTPVLLEGMLIFGTSGGELIGVDRVVGGRRLEVSGLGAVPGVITDGESLYFGTSNYYVYCYTTLGSRMWGTIVEGQVSKPLVLAGDRLYADVMGIGVTALAKKDGALIWRKVGAEKFLTTDGARVFAVASSPQTSTGDPRGESVRELWVLDAADGALLSRLDIHEFDFSPPSTSNDGFVVVATKEGRVVCLKAK